MRITVFFVSGWRRTSCSGNSGAFFGNFLYFHAVFIHSAGAVGYTGEKMKNRHTVVIRNDGQYACRVVGGSQIK